MHHTKAKSNISNAYFKMCIEYLYEYILRKYFYSGSSHGQYHFYVVGGAIILYMAILKIGSYFRKTFCSVFIKINFYGRGG